MTGVLGALGVAAAALWVMPGAADAFEGPKGLVWAVVAVALALAGLARQGAIESKGLKGLASTTLAGLLLAWMALRTVSAVWDGGWAALADAARPWAAWATPLVVFLLAVRLPWSAEGRRGLARTIVALGVAEALVMLLQRFGLDPLFGSTTREIAYGPGRMIGTVGYQNQAAEFLGVALCCVPVAWRNRWMRAGVVLVLAGTIFLTANRGAMLGLGVVAVLVGTWWGWRAKDRIRWLLPAVLLVAGGLAMAVPETRARLAEVAAPGRSVAVRSRAWMARVAVALWSDHPLCGAGAGAYEREYVDRLGKLLPEEKSLELLQTVVWAREAHCDPLQFGAEFGWVGLAMLAGFGIVLWKSRRRTPEEVAALTAASFLSVCSLFSFSWQTTLAAPTVALLLGASRGRDSVSGRHPVFLGGFVRLAAAALLLLAAWMPSDAAHTSPGALAERADALLREGHAAESLEVWQRLVRAGLLPDAALHGKSRALEALGRTTEAVAAEKIRFRQFGPNFTDIELYRLSVLELQIGDFGQAGNNARTFFRRCHVFPGRADRWTPEWSNLLGAALLAAGRAEEARLWFLDALERNPSLSSARRNLAACSPPSR